MAGQEEDRWNSAALLAWTGKGLKSIKRFGAARIRQFSNIFSFQDSTEPPECKLPGCNNRCYIEKEGTVHDFCRKSHAREYGALTQKYRDETRAADDTGWVDVEDGHVYHNDASFEGIGCCKAADFVNSKISYAFSCL